MFCVLKKKVEQNKNDEKYSQTGMTVQIYTNNDSVRMTVIMLRSILTSSSSQSLVISVEIASEITSNSLQVNKELALISLPLEWKATSVN